jgi:DNA-directed RNA polymerase specialized sigma24 family protein
MDLPTSNVLPTTTARTAPASVTAYRLGEVWPEVSARLDRMLASRGVDPVQRQDIAQEVALRALDKQVPFTDPGDLYRWAATTARNLHVDLLRTGGRTTGDDALVVVADPSDVAHTAERRVALGHVWRALALMRPDQQEAILESLDEDRHARSSQLLVRRHRARATLRRAVGGVLAGVGAARLRLRTLGAAAPAVTSMAAVAVLAPVLALDLARPAIHRPAVVPAPALTVLDGAARPATVAVRNPATRQAAVARRAAVPSRRRAQPPGATRKPIAAVAAPGGWGASAEQRPNPGGDRRGCVGSAHDPEIEVCARPGSFVPQFPPVP